MVLTLYMSTRVLHLDSSSLFARLVEDLRKTSGSSSKRSTLATNEVPGQVKHLVKSLKTTTAGLRKEEPDPDETDCGDTAEEHHGAAGGHRQEHERDSLRVSVLVDEVERHGERSTQGTQAKWVDLRVDQVLDRVPAQCPTETAEVDHNNSAHCRVLLTRGLGYRFVRDSIIDEEEDGHVEHGDKLNGDAGR